MDTASRYSKPFTPNDRVFSLLAMTVGASFLTVSASEFNLEKESKSRTIITAAFAGFLFLCGMVLLLATHQRLGLPVWNLFIVGSVCGAGALGLAVLVIGSQQAFKVWACSTWGWVIGMCCYSWIKAEKKHAMRTADSGAV